MTKHTRKDATAFSDAQPVRMKETAADQAVRDKAFRATREQLEGYLTEIERARDQKAQFADQEKAVFAQAKATGYDVKAMRTVLKIRADPKSREALEEHNAVVDLYLDTLN